MTEKQAENCIASSALDKLLAAHDGDVALLWLYCMRHGAPDEEKAAQTLCRTLQEIRAAEEKLRRMDTAISVPQHFVLSCSVFSSSS